MELHNRREGEPPCLVLTITTMDWEAHRLHLLSVPHREGLQALAKDVSRGSKPRRYWRLGGGLGAATHALDLETRSGRILRLVLKRFDTSARFDGSEWKRLRFAAELDVPTPAPVALDQEGRWFGGPSFVMTRIPGRPDVNPANLDRWLNEIADVLLGIHHHSISGAPTVMRAPHRLESWKPPEGIRLSPLVERAIEQVEGHLPSAFAAKRVVSHGDFHPGNLLWRKGRLSGVVDWSAAHLMPRAYDVAYCRADLTVLLGLDAAQRFLRIYEKRFGAALDDLWVWDLMCALSAVRWGHLYVQGYREQGRDDLTARNVWPRASALLRSALE